MIKLILSALLAVFLFSGTANAVDHEVKAEWIQIASAGETVIVTAEDGKIVMLWSVGQPATKKKKGMRLNQEDSLVFTTTGDLWAKANQKINSAGVKVTVNAPLEVNTP